MNSIPALAPRIALTLALFLVAQIGVARADVIDLSLNVFYSNDVDPTSGGTWQVAAKTDQFGLADVFFSLRNIDSTGYLNLAPNGTVNDGDVAGFSFTSTSDQGGYYTFGLYQALLGSPEKSPFYGVGSIINPDGATPNYTDQPTDFPNATAIGPVLTTLENLNNPLWGNGDPLGDTDWDHAAILLSGTFAAGQTPAFYTTSSVYAKGDVFISLPADTSTAGERSSVFEATTVVRTNLTTPTADYGDYNGDGIVNLADFTVWRNTLGATVTPAGSGADGDLSGVVDAGDYDVWKNNFGLPATPLVAGSLTTAPVPEPNSLVLLILAAVFAQLTRAPRNATGAPHKRLYEIFLKKRYSP